MRVGAAWRDACILDLSSRGLMIQASEPLRDGSYIEVRRGRHVIGARVMWSNDRRCGFLTQDPLPTDALIAEPDLSEGRRLLPRTSDAGIEPRRRRATLPTNSAGGEAGRSSSRSL